MKCVKERIVPCRRVQQFLGRRHGLFRCGFGLGKDALPCERSTNTAVQKKTKKCFGLHTCSCDDIAARKTERHFQIAEFSYAVPL